MARTSTPHPALVAKRARALAQLEKEALTSLDSTGVPGWERFNDNKKRFLLMRTWYGNDRDTSRAIGLNPKWAEVIKVRDKLFRDACNNRAVTPVVVARRTFIDLLGMSMVRLAELLGQTSDRRLSLEAIKHLHALVGLAPMPGAKLGSSSFISTANIVMFGDQQKGQAEQARMALEAAGKALRQAGAGGEGAAR